MVIQEILRCEMQPNELATILAALRQWQEQLISYGPSLRERYPQLDGLPVCTVADINKLCEKLNTSVTRQQQVSRCCACGAVNGTLTPLGAQQYCDMCWSDANRNSPVTEPK